MEDLQPKIDRAAMDHLFEAKRILVSAGSGAILRVGIALVSKDYSALTREELFEHAIASAIATNLISGGWGWLNIIRADK